jgi:hypothetical protein
MNEQKPEARSLPGRAWRGWLDDHLASVRGRRDVGWVVARNLIPVVGVVAFGWSAQLALLNYWYDGYSALIAVLAVITPSAVRSAPELASAGRLRRIAANVVVWALLAVVLGLPYWLALAFTGLLESEALWQRVATDRWLWLTAALILAINLQYAISRRYAQRDERDFKQTLRWDFYLLILRALAMIWFAMPVPALTVIALALVMIYLELFPAKALGAIWGDPDKLWMDDADRRRAEPAGRTRRRRGKRRGQSSDHR